VAVRQRSGSTSLLGPRSVNEDSFELSDMSRDGGDVLAVLAVADGMGGLSGGDVASATAIEAVRAAFVSGGRGQEIAEVPSLVDGMIRDLASARGSEMGTTLTAALVDGGEATVVHVGDTRAYVVHGGAISQITEDHSRVGRLLAEGVLTEAEAMTHPDQNVLERALGAGESTSDVYRIGIGPGDLLFICSDGLHTFVESSEIGFELENNASLQSACERLARLAEERGSDDNITAVAWEYPSPQQPGDGHNAAPTNTIITRRGLETDTVGFDGLAGAATGAKSVGLAVIVAACFFAGLALGLIASVVFS